MKTVLAIAAHPDDIEMMMAGTLLLLKKAGYQIHYMNLACGNLGSTEHDSKTTRKIRLGEAKKAAKILGATFHPPLCNDLEIFYDLKTLRLLAAVVRKVQPTIVLTHSPVDYMEDHTTTCRLVVTATFARGMPNFKTIPALSAGAFDCTLYHAMPHTLRDHLRKRMMPGAYVNTTEVHGIKMEALQAHKSQQNWLNESQNMNSYLQAMDDISAEVGKMSKAFEHAEGWRRHLEVGFCTRGADPLQQLGNDYLLSEAYERDLESGF